VRSTKRHVAADALDPLLERLKGAVAVAGPDGVDYAVLAGIAESEFPDLTALLGRAQLVEWVRKEVRKMRDDEGVPLIGSFKGRAVQIDFWDVEMFRTAIDHYVSPARKNLALAQGLADECARIHGVRLMVPQLAGDERVQAVG